MNWSGNSFALWARPFDLSSHEVYGQGAQLIEHVREYRFSDTGTLIYVEMSPETLAAVAVSHDGVSRPLWAMDEDCFHPRLSPGGQELAVTCADILGRLQIWVGDIDRGTFSERPFSGDNVAPIWTPDGQSITHSSREDDRWRIIMRPAGGGGPARELLQAEYPLYPQSWSPDGGVLAYLEHHPETGENVRLLPLEDGGLPLDFAASAALESGAMFSPDGKWIVYHSNESGDFHTYVQPYPGPGERIQISSEFGGWPVWSRDGRAIYYMTYYLRAMLAVDVSYDSGFVAAKPRRLFETEGRFYAANGVRSHAFDISADGREFVMIESILAEAGPATELKVVLNWFDELKRLVPTDP